MNQADLPRIRGSITGFLAAGYFVLIAAGALAQRGNPRMSLPVAGASVLFGLVALLLLWLAWRRIKPELVMRVGRNLCVVFALMLVYGALTAGKPEAAAIIMLVMRLALVWIIYTALRHLYQPPVIATEASPTAATAGDAATGVDNSEAPLADSTTVEKLEADANVSAESSTDNPVADSPESRYRDG